MNLKLKIWLILSVVVAIVLTIDAILAYKKLAEEMDKEAREDAKVVYSYMMSTRRIYQEQFIESGLPINRKTIGFLPAHSMNRISKDFANWNNSGMTFNNVSDKPRNPDNLVDRFELDDMEWYRQNSKETKRMRKLTLADGQQVTQYTSPIWIEPFCLKCHSSKESSPPGMVELYPDDPAYGYQVGDLRGLISIRIPTSRLQNQIINIWIGSMVQSLIGYLLLLLVLGYLFDRLVTKRLSRLKGSADELASGDYSIRIENKGKDEICQLGECFNHMASEIEKRSFDLVKLSSAVEQSPESVFITDREARIEYVNYSFTETTGYSSEEILGNTPKFLQSGLTEKNLYKSLWSALNRGEVWTGEFINRRKDGSLFSNYSTISPIRDVHGDITHYVATQQDMTEKQQVEERIHRLSYFDELTDLPNRLNLTNRLEQLAFKSNRTKKINALILLNIDRFKNINNARGLIAGDILLKKIAVCLGDLIRHEDVLAHLSGDEFAIVISEIGRDYEKANRQLLVITEKIHSALSRPLDIGDESISITVSIGVKLFPLEFNESTDDVLQLADTALHKAKEVGGNTTFFYEHEMGEKAKERFQIERELRESIKEKQLLLYLQPQVNKSGKLLSAEVLVRWNHPKRGLVPPGLFIPIAEESDLIIELSDWIFTEACKLIVNQSMQGKSLRLSVNISPRHFAQSNFVEWAHQVVKNTGVDPTLITMEVTEGLMISDVSDVISKMNKLVEMGIHFSVDDFGTGYSGLAYLKRLPISEVKIDKMFVQDAPNDPDDAVLVETILSVAKHMGLNIVAEGVETQEQADVLNSRADVIHQGDLYGKPEPADYWIKCSK